MDRNDKEREVGGADLQHDDPLDDTTPAAPGEGAGAAVTGEPELRERTLPGPGDQPPGVVVDPDPRS